MDDKKVIIYLVAVVSKFNCVSIVIQLKWTIIKQ